MRDGCLAKMRRRFPLVASCSVSSIRRATRRATRSGRQFGERVGSVRKRSSLLFHLSHLLVNEEANPIQGIHCDPEQSISLLPSSRLSPVIRSERRRFKRLTSNMIVPPSNSQQYITPLRQNRDLFEPRLPNQREGPQELLFRALLFPFTTTTAATRAQFSQRDEVQSITRPDEEVFPIQDGPT